MKVAMLFTGSGPIVILTSHDSVTDPALIEKLEAKGIERFLAYELPLLKLHLFHHLPEFLEKWQDDRRRLDGWIRAKRVHDLLDSIEDVKDDSIVPSRSLLREFIGGSAYDVH